MGALIAWLGTALASLLESGVLRFLAYKVILKVLLVVILPVVLYNLLFDLLTEYLQFVSDQMSSSGVQPFVFQLSGLAGYMADRLGIIAGVSMLISALVIKLTFRMIPFLGRS